MQGTFQFLTFLASVASEDADHILLFGILASPTCTAPFSLDSLPTSQTISFQIPLPALLVSNVGVLQGPILVPLLFNLHSLLMITSTLIASNTTSALTSHKSSFSHFS